MYAVEKSAKRCAVLRKMVADSGADRVTEVINSDFLLLDPGDYPDVRHIVLDPSCSGSGMVARGETEADGARLRRLAFLQSKLLSHALSFPNLRSMVYSTCSVSREENEEVVASALEAAEGRFEVRLALPSWPRRGEGGFPFSDRVIRCSAEGDLCNGFFVALITKKKKKKKRKVNDVESGTEDKTKKHKAD